MVFKNKMKIVIYLMHYNALYHWSKFNTNLSIFQWVTSKKTPRSSLKLYILLTWKHLKFQNSRTIRHRWNLAQTCITWTLFIYQNMRVSINRWAVAGVGTTKKPPEIVMKLRESWLSHHLKPTQKRLKRRRFFIAIHNHLTLALT